MMKRDDCLKILARHVTDEIVVATYQAAFEWMAIKPRALNYLSTGAMGQASSHALGLAVGRPDKRVIVLDGDGSLLMNLGTLVTIAGAAPRNLIHFVCANGTYEVNGAHPLPGLGRADFSGFARAAGYAVSDDFSELADFEARIGNFLRLEGPTFGALHVVPGEAYPQDFPKIHSAETRRAFKAALGAS